MQARQAGTQYSPGGTPLTIAGVLASNTTQVATIPLDNEGSRQGYTGFAVAKVSIYAFHGLISRPSLFFNVLMIPAVLLGATPGRWIVDRIPERIFEAVIVLLTRVRP